MLFSFPVIADSLWPCGLQHARPLCSSPSLEVCARSCLLPQWCHPAILSSNALFSFCPQSFPASGALSQLFISDNQNTGISASASDLLMSIQGWIPLRLVWSPCCPRDSQESCPAPQFKGINSFALHLLYSPALTTLCDHWEDHCLDLRTFVGKVMSPLLNTLSRFAIAFLPRSKRLLISWLQSPSAVILEPKKRKPITTSTFSPLFATK